MLNWEKKIDVLKKKKVFCSAEESDCVKASELMSVLAKKLSRSGYCSLKVKYAEVKSKDDLTIIKEIAF